MANDLRSEIDRYLKKGFRVVSETEMSAQLIKPKVFSFVWALFWFLFLGVGVLVYIFYYMSKKDKTVYLRVSDDGQVQVT